MRVKNKRCLGLLVILLIVIIVCLVFVGIKGVKVDNKSRGVEDFIYRYICCIGQGDFDGVLRMVQGEARASTLKRAKDFNEGISDISVKKVDSDAIILGEDFYVVDSRVVYEKEGIKDVRMYRYYIVGRGEGLKIVRVEEISDKGRIRGESRGRDKEAEEVALEFFHLVGGKDFKEAYKFLSGSLGEKANIGVLKGVPDFRIKVEEVCSVYCCEDESYVKVRYSLGEKEYKAILRTVRVPEPVILDIIIESYND